MALVGAMAAALAAEEGQSLDALAPAFAQLDL
jgi:hypothetical protein